MFDNSGKLVGIGSKGVASLAVIVMILEAAVIALVPGNDGKNSWSPW